MQKRGSASAAFLTVWFLLAAGAGLAGANVSAAPALALQTATAETTQSPVNAEAVRGLLLRWGGVAALAVAAGAAVLSVFFYYRLRRRLASAERELKSLAGRVEGDSAVAELLRCEFQTKLDETLMSMDGKIGREKERVDRLLEQIEELQEGGPPPVVPDPSAVTAHQDTAGSPAHVPEPDGMKLLLPALASDLVAWLEKEDIPLTTVKVDLSRFTNLSKAEDGAYWLADVAGGAREWFVLPRTQRFGSPQEFYVHYQQYYDCVQPAAGDIEIVEPTIVVADEEQGGWKLKQKGRLQMR
jgi:hypothetical protein